jgi:hypothetical protein
MSASIELDQVTGNSFRIGLLQRETIENSPDVDTVIGRLCKQ